MFDFANFINANYRNHTSLDGKNFDFIEQNWRLMFAKTPPLHPVRFGKHQMVKLPFLSKVQNLGHGNHNAPTKSKILNSEGLKTSGKQQTQHHQTTDYQ